jgi:hypothetical protein
MSTLRSNMVNVFPCASRTGDYQVEARLLSEKNMTELVKHITTSDGSFVISDDGKEFMLGGYYFKLDNSYSFGGLAAYASLVFTNNDNNILDGDSVNDNFNGLDITSTEPDKEIWIQLWDGAKVPEVSKISFIKKSDTLELDCGEFK